MRITLVDARSRQEGLINKDLSAGFGTSSVYGHSWTSRVMIALKRRAIQMPILSLGYVSGALRSHGHEVTYSTSQDQFPESDMYLVYTSLVEHQTEVAAAMKLKKRGKYVGFLGPFATAQPERFANIADFIVKGEPESFAMQVNGGHLEGIVPVDPVSDLDQLAFPDWTPFPYARMSYGHYLKGSPVFPVLTTRGCPYSCGYYCPYPSIQGRKVRRRSAPNVIDELLYLIKRFGARGVIFRDPIFTVDKARTIELVEAILQKDLKLKWACETHLSTLTPALIDLMHRAGLRGINVGVESAEAEVLRQTRRKSDSLQHQEFIINYCERKGIRIGAFYIIGSPSDTKESLANSLNYAKQLNTSYAQFTLSTPYPGTEFFDSVKDQIFEKNWDKFDIYTPTYAHPTLSSSDQVTFKERSVREYYFRPAWMFKYLHVGLRQWLS